MNTVDFFSTSCYGMVSPFMSIFLLYLLMLVTVLPRFEMMRARLRNSIIAVILALMLPPAMATTPPGNALTFDGLNDYVAISPSSAISWNDASAMTVEAWIKTTETKSTNDILSWSDGGTNVIEFRTYNGKLELIKSGIPTHVISATSINTGNWVHVAAVKDSSNNVTLYVNGVQEGTATLNINNIPLNLFYIGVLNFSGVNTGYCFNGQMDEVRVWNVARTPAQIRQSMNTTLTGSETGLVAYYNFDQTSGTSLPDLTGGNNNGTLTNMTGSEWTDSGAIITPPGNALSFNGSNNYVQTNDVNLGTSDFTIEGWINPINVSSAYIYTNRTGETTEAGNWFAIGFFGSDKLSLGLATCSASYMQVSGNTSLAPNKWYHIAIVRNSTTIMMYLNGVLDGQFSDDSSLRSLTTGNNIARFGDWTGYNKWYSGQIDEFRVWKSALTKTQIQTNMHNTLVGNEANLEAYYKFDLTTGTVLPDITGHGHDGTLVNSPAWETSGAMAPSPISASNVTTTGFTANWNAVSGATGYRIDIFDSALNSVGTDIPAGSGTTFNTGLTLTPGATYYFLMRAEKGTWTSPNSAPVSFLFAPGNSLLFATDQRVNCGTGASLKPTTAFTVEAWVKPTTNSQSGWLGAGIIASDSDNDASGGMTGTYFSVRSGLFGAIRTANGRQELTGNPVPLAWQHVAMVFNGTSLTLYQNGVATASKTFASTTIVPSANPFFIAGSGLNNGWYNFQGQIDEVRVWDVARSQTDIQSNLYHTLAGNETGLVAYYNFDHASGTTMLADLAGGDNNGSVVGSPTWTAATWNYGFPYVTTGSAILTTPTTATVSGSLVDGGLSAITAIGICYATTANPTTPCTTSGFPGLLTGLTPNTTYHARAYATNSYGTSYGDDVLIAPGNALSFNGSNHVNVGTGFNIANQSFTVEFWAKRNPSTVYQMAISQGTAGADQGLALGFIDTNQFDFSFWGDDLITTTAYTESDWHHWAGVYDTSIAAGTNRWLYRDGVLVASDRAAGNYQGSGNFYIGMTSYTGDHFPGEIDEVRVWNVARAQSEIQSNLYHTLTGNEAGLVAYYNFDHTSGTTLTDLAGRDNNGSLVGSPTWTAATWNYGFPYITTGAATSVRATTALVAGTLVDPGTSTVTTSGICYATTAFPTTPCNPDGATTATTFTSNLTGLTPNGTLYYARAYATNAYGTNYGSDVPVPFITHYLPVIAEGTVVSVSMSQGGSPVAWAPPTLTASDVDGDTLTWSVNTQAIHGTATVSGTGASPTTFIYTPNSGFSGSDSFVVQVADVDGVATITVNVNVSATYPIIASTPTFDQIIKFDTLVGKTQVQTVTFQNLGDSALIFNSVNTPVVPFSYPKPLPFTFIPWGGVPLTTQTLELSCTPTVAGLKTMTVQIATNDPYTPRVNYPLECMGRQPGAVSSVANNTPLNFGTGLINSTLTQTISFSENGNSDLMLNSATITGANAADFKITSPTSFPVTIADGATASQAITVTCTPTTAIALNATLQITTNDPLNATLTYPLQCAGLYSLTLSTSGQGTIAGCGSSCTQNYSQDAAVTISATPATGWQFSSWTGDCVNGQVTMTGNKSCTANFTQIVTNTTNPGTTTPGGSTTTPGNTTTTPTNPVPPGTGTGTTPPGSTTNPPGTTTPPGTTPTTPTGSGSTTTPPSNLTTSVLATVPISNAMVDGAMSNYYQTATNLTVLPNGSVSGGTVAGEVTNQGLIANITIAPDTTVSGGKLSGFNTNSGLLNDVTVSQYSQVQGGNYAGTIVNNGTLNNPILSSSSAVVNNGVIENPVILPGANISGGKLTGTIIVLGTFDNVDISAAATVITQVAAIPPAIFKNISAQTLALLSPSVVSQITPEQFAQIPVAALSGLTAENMGAVSPQVAQSLDAEHIAALDPETFKAMPSDSVAKLLTNFDTQAITPQEAEKLLPKGWTIDANGNLTAPPGSKIAAKSLNLSQLPAAGITLPNMTDLNSSFALGGKGTKPLTNQLNQASTTAGVTVTQQQTGVVHADVAGSAGYGQKSKFAFMIDPNNLFILDENALRGLQINEQGQYVIVTEDGKQIPITPMTQDPEALLTVLGENATVDIRPTGEVLIKHKPIKRSRDGEEVYSIGMFDPFIEPAPEDICTPDGCNWDQADAWMQPGLRSGKNLRAKAAAKIIYPDGTSQQLYPTVLSPDILVEEGKKFEGVEKIIFRMDGTFAVTYQGTKILLIPEFDAQMQPIPAGKKFKPSLTLQPNGKLLYQVPYGDQLFTTTLSVTEAPSP